ncbi:MAG TPA: helix-turn-helix domain-containing protein [Stenotrophomonas sp.]|nr:helix-turn-helix domain-containing protein [Stenotrophomonas sp.]
MPGDSRYREAAPPPAAQTRVRRLWRYRAADAPAEPARILPDGCIDLIWDGRALFVAGPDRIAAMAALVPGSVLTGLRLAPGAARDVLGVPMQELTGTRVALSALWGRRAQSLEAGLAAGQQTPAQLLLDAVARAPATADTRMAWLFARLSSADAPRLPVLARQLAMSERTLRRHCLAHFGYGPKTLDRILRLQRLLSAPRPGTLTEAALAAGYADAAHLVHDSRDLTGLTPGALLHAHGR